jgi:prepilin-type N-terminal cleavage/methylation domain-containing protein
LRVNVSESRPPLQGGSSQGFSLLEVLVATALMGLIMVVLMQGLSSATRAQEASRRNTQAILVAEKVLAEYCGGKTLEAGSYQGREGPFGFTVTIAPQYEVGELGSPQMLRCSLIQVTVTWREFGRAKSLKLETMRAVTQHKGL